MPLMNFALIKNIVLICIKLARGYAGQSDFSATTVHSFKSNGIDFIGIFLGTAGYILDLSTYMQLLPHFKCLLVFIQKHYS